MSFCSHFGSRLGTWPRLLDQSFASMPGFAWSDLGGIDAASPIVVHGWLGSRRMRVGGLDHMEALAMLPEGPSAVKDLFEWPRRALQKLLAAPGVDQKTRALKELGQRKVLLYSYYSGKGSEATIAEHLDAVFSEAGIVENEGKFFHVMHAAELDNFCQTILLRAATNMSSLTSGTASCQSA